MKKGISKGVQQFKSEQRRIEKTFTEAYQEYMHTLKNKGRSEITIKTYANHMKYFSKFTGDNILCKDIREETLNKYIDYLSEKGIKSTSINSYIQNISPIIKYCIKQGYIAKDFLTPYVKVQEEFKEILTEEELNVLLQKPRNKEFATVRTYTIVWVLASTGIRATELRNLKVKNVDILNRSIACNNTKNRKARYLPISNSLAEVLYEYLSQRQGEGEEYLFPTVYGDIMSRTTLQKSIYMYCKERGVAKRGIHIHRHTFITNSVNKNVSPLILKGITGHSTFKELNHYYNSSTTSMIEIIDDIAPNINQKKSQFKKR
ncbi:tyrosine-type recombinase/integrase [Proteiniclasticum sp.]|uniref:tyrosine-type recombinase/integrase n=1 Tax=Proteiniclasticum sp. TaxID=2053595 RepID=UPI00289B2998|nr:tyrosine-type recombinase/integrase [Proteiniclasticum sp.]